MQENDPGYFLILYLVQQEREHHVPEYRGLSAAVAESDGLLGQLYRLGQRE